MADKKVFHVNAQAPCRARPVVTISIQLPAVAPFEIDVYLGDPGHEKKITQIMSLPGIRRIDHVFEPGEWMSLDTESGAGSTGAKLHTRIEWEPVP